MKGFRRVVETSALVIQRIDTFTRLVVQRIGILLTNKTQDIGFHVNVSFNS